MAGGGGCCSNSSRTNYVKMKKSANFLFLVVLVIANNQQGVEGARGGGSGTQVAPRIVDDPSNVTVLRNEPATLRCAVDGQPQPEVSWYRDGEALEPRGHRLVLPDGALFFLRVTQGRSGGGGGGRNNNNNNGDAGTYWCVARNSAGMARSRNATLTVAYLQPDFRRVPEPSRSVVGESVRLQCQAPRGQPEAEVTWRKNGVSIGAWDDDLALDKERIHVEETGDLIIRHVLASDEGKYQCVAHNMAATRESPAVSLSVYVRPQVSIPQPDLMVVVGDEASFECQASGDPAPELLWRRLSDNSALPVQQSTSGDNRSTFKIERVELSDAGAYACEVENAVGKVSSTAVLTVLIPPSWSPEPPPSDIQTEAGRPLAIDCSVTGTPTPLIFWRREGAAMDNSSRWSIALNGTLMIHNIQPEDAGSLYCAAVNAGGALLARVNLEVTLPIHSVPPHFLIGPANQTLPIRSPALLQCQVARPDPDPDHNNATEVTIHWTRDGLPLNQNSSNGSGSGSSFQILPSGSLQIDHLKVEDSGTYTCWAATGVGSKSSSVSSWTANLLVENPINPNVAFNRAPSDPLALPGPPSQPVATNQTAHSVTVTWQSSSRMGASPLIGYTVEIYSPKASVWPGSWSWSDERNEVNASIGWLVAARRLKANSFTIDGLTAGTWLLCLVRAENSHGLSLPSPISRWIYSTSASSSSDADLMQTRDLLSGSLLHLDRVQSISSNTVELHWDIVDGESYIEGLYLYHFESSAPSLLPVPVQSSQVIKDPGAMSHIVSQLRPDTNYTFFLVPFYGSVEGRPSNSRTIKTNPDAPSGYPQNVTVRQFNDSSVLIQWLPPPEEECNGVIIAYQIFVYSAETGMLLANLTLPSTSTSIAVGGLDGGTRYAFRAAAWTQVGLGPNSPAVVLAVEMNQATSTVLMTDPEINSFPSNVAQETWMIILVGGTLLVLLLTVILVVIIRRRKVCKHQNRATNGRGAQNGGRGNQSHLLWPLPTQPWMNNCSTNGGGGDPTKEVHPQLGPDYAEVFHHANPSMSSFNTQPTAAYASTTLIRNTTSSLPFRYQPTGRSVPHLDPSSSSGGMMSRNSSQPLVPNWLEMLPPPPQHPPPPLVVSPDRAGSSSNSSNAKGEFPAFLTATLPSTIQQHYPFRSSYNAQSQPTLLAQHVRNSFLQQQQQQQQYRNSGMSRYQSDEIPQEGLYATCTYDQIEPYPLSSYR